MLPEPVNAALCLLVLGSAAATIAAQLAERRRVEYVCKPLTMLLILALAAQPSVATSPAYRATLCAGLVFSLLGDVLLMLPSNRFVQGLASFLVAHLLYIAAFVRDAGFGAAPLALAVLVLAAGGLTAALWPRLGRMRAPVAVYVAAIVTMAWQGSARWESVGQLGSLLACLGAWLFVASDAALAWNRFGRPFAASPLVVLSTYFVGQLLLALSTGVGEALVDRALR